jgi:hypothetical protein
MRARPRVSLLVVALAVAVGCGPRQVEVRTAPTAAATQTVSITNNLSQAVNVSITGVSPEVFLRQVPANTVESVAVPADIVGKTVTFKAVTVDGSRTYQSRSVLYSGSFIWSVP